MLFEFTTDKDSGLLIFLSGEQRSYVFVQLEDRRKIYCEMGYNNIWKKALTLELPEDVSFCTGRQVALTINRIGDNLRLALDYKYSIDNGGVMYPPEAQYLILNHEIFFGGLPTDSEAYQRAKDWGLLSRMVLRSKLYLTY